MPPHTLQRPRDARVGESVPPHGDGEAGAEFRAWLGAVKVPAAAGERIGRCGHGLEADEVLALRCVHLRDRVPVFEAHLQASPAALEREHGIFVEAGEEGGVDPPRQPARPPADPPPPPPTGAPLPPPPPPAPPHACPPPL